MHRLSLLAVLILIACAGLARGDTLFVYDGFAYTNNLTVDGKGTSNNGWNGAWAEMSSPSQASGILVSNTNLPSVGSVKTSGMTLKATGATNDPQIWRNLQTNYNASTIGGNTLWLSFMLRKDANGSFANSDYASVRLNNLSVAVNTAGKYALEDVSPSGSTGSQASTVSAQVGDSVLLIVSIEFDFSGTGDRVRLFEATNASPNPTVPIASKTFDVGTISNVGVLFGYTAGWTFDEFRMGDSSAAVAPTPEPSSLGLLIFGATALLRRRRASH
jgi:hypothetical protein